MNTNAPIEYLELLRDRSNFVEATCDQLVADKQESTTVNVETTDEARSDL
ncbi:MAG TPA: hypothetical protein V6C63_07720 [Allocoleopsis sp.]